MGFARSFFSYLPFFLLDWDFWASNMINNHSGKFCALLGTSVLREEFFLTGHQGKVTMAEQSHPGPWTSSHHRASCCGKCLVAALLPREPPALVPGGSLEAEPAQEALKAQEAAPEILGFHPRICLWAGSWNLVEFFK